MHVHLSGLGEHLAHVECCLRLRMLRLQRPALRHQRVLLLRRTGDNTCNTCSARNTCSTCVEERELLRVLAAELAQLLQHLQTSASVSIRQHPSASISIRQHTSAYVSIHQAI